jgi:autoinducer 2-degrading protein
MSLFIVHVQVRVKGESVAAFREATLANAGESVKEAGVARFDVIQELEDPTRFVLVEVYRSPEAAALHKETPHYIRWRDTVAAMMEEPRNSVRYQNVFPQDAGW